MRVSWRLYLLPLPSAGPQRVRDQPRPALLPHRPPEPRAAVHAVGGCRHLRWPRQHQRESHHRACWERYGGGHQLVGGPACWLCCPLPLGLLWLLRISQQQGTAGVTRARGRGGMALGGSWLSLRAGGSAHSALPTRLTSSLPPSPCQDHLFRRHRHHPVDEGREAAVQLRWGAGPRHQVDQGQVVRGLPARAGVTVPAASPLLCCAQLTHPLLSRQ